MKKQNFKKLLALALVAVMAMSMMLLTSCGSDKDDDDGDSLDGTYVAVSSNASFDSCEIDGNELSVEQSLFEETIVIVYSMEIDEDGKGNDDAEEMGLASVTLTYKKYIYEGDNETLKEQVEEANERIAEGEADDYAECETFLRIDDGFYINSRLYLEESVYDDIEVEDAFDDGEIADGTYIASDFVAYNSYNAYKVEIDGKKAIVSYAEGIEVIGTYEINSSYLSFIPTEVEYYGDNKDIQSDVEYANECIEDEDYCDFTMSDLRISNDDKGLNIDYELFIKIK